MQRLPLPIPNGWFRVAYSHALVPGGVMPLRYFGTDLVLFRTMDGTPHLLDAHCAHLGAHLGHGGRVEGHTIRCPFHGWGWDGQGRCVSVPYASTIPSTAQVRTWPVREVNGVIAAYYHAQAEPPAWQIPALPEYTSAAWTPFRPVHSWKIRAHVQDIAENGIDTAHMSLVHQRQTRAITSGTLEATGPILVHRMLHTYNLFWPSKLLGAPVAGPLEITYYGLGWAVNRASVRTVLHLKYLYLFLLTPIDAESMDLQAVFSMQKVINRALTWALSAKAIQEGARTIIEDIPIWEHKTYYGHPLLCDSDGPIRHYRQWARQFYTELPNAEGQASGAGNPSQWSMNPSPWSL